MDWHQVPQVDSIEDITIAYVNQLLREIDGLKRLVKRANEAPQAEEHESEQMGAVRAKNTQLEDENRLLRDMLNIRRSKPVAAAEFADGWDLGAAGENQPDMGGVPAEDLVVWGWDSTETQMTPDGRHPPFTIYNGCTGDQVSGHKFNSRWAAEQYARTLGEQRK